MLWWRGALLSDLILWTLQFVSFTRCGAPRADASVWCWPFGNLVPGVPAWLFSQAPASFSVHLLPFPDQVLAAVPAEDLESFGPPEPLPLLSLFQLEDLAL